MVSEPPELDTLRDAVQEFAEARTEHDPYGLNGTWTVRVDLHSDRGDGETWHLTS